MCTYVHTMMHMHWMDPMRLPFLTILATHLYFGVTEKSGEFIFTWFLAMISIWFAVSAFQDLYYLHFASRFYAAKIGDVRSIHLPYILYSGSIENVSENVMYCNVWPVHCTLQMNFPVRTDRWKTNLIEVSDK